MVDIGVDVERWLVVGHLFLVVLEVRHDQKYVRVVLYDAARMDCCVFVFDEERDRRNLCI